MSAQPYTGDELLTVAAARAVGNDDICFVRITVGFLGAAQLDRYGNINTTVIGPYATPSVRLPGAGGAPDMAVACQRIFIVMPHSTRGMVDRIDFITSFGHGTGGDARARLGIDTAGPVKVITDHCIL